MLVLALPLASLALSTAKPKQRLPDDRFGKLGALPAPKTAPCRRSRACAIDCRGQRDSAVSTVSRRAKNTGGRADARRRPALRSVLSIAPRIASSDWNCRKAVLSSGNSWFPDETKRENARVEFGDLAEHGRVDDRVGRRARGIAGRGKHVVQA